MLGHLLRRLASTLLLVLLVSSAAFVLTRLAPGDSAQVTGGFGASREQIARERALAGLDRPLLVQWASWIGGIARFDLGPSTLYQQPAGPLVASRAGHTAILALASLLLALLLGIPPAFLSATRPRSFLAHAIRASSLVLLSIPPFIGSLALVLLAVRTGWFPAGGMTSAPDLAGLAYMRDVAWHLPLPVLALALPLAATFERLQAQALGEALRHPAVQAARARGIPPARVLVHHAWRLSLKPVAAVAGLACGALLSGSFVVEMVTSWPGLGRLTFDALLHRDMNLVAGCAAAGTLLLGLGLLAADAVIAWADPRITSPGVSTEGRAA